MLYTDAGPMTFERYFVKEGQKPGIDGVAYSGSGFAEPAPGVLEAIEDADIIVFAPSNPVASIQPILSVKKVRASVLRSEAFKVAVSPIIAGRTVKGPADKMMRALGYDVSPVGVAEFYDGMIDCLLLDRADQALKAEVSSLGVKAVVDDILMPDVAAKIRLGESVLRAKTST
jgi:LPPG:FO 2-phospho-L-lactate transferase